METYPTTLAPRRKAGGRRRRSSFGRRKAPLRWRVLLIFIALVLLVIYLDCQLHPLVKAFGETQAKFEATKIINEAVTDVLTDADMSYEELVKVAKNEYGEMESVEADVVKINQLKAAITTTILDRLAKQEKLEMRIPLGSLFGGDWLNGRGPRLPLRVAISGNAITTFHSAFTSAGINQTNHQITLDIESLIVTTIPGYTTAVKVETSFVVAETVLVGKVPDSFTEVDGSQAGDIGKIFAYGGQSK